MTAGMMARVATGGRKLAAQVVVSVVATGTAALVVPQILAALGYGGRSVPASPAAVMSPVAAPADFEAAFVWPVQTPPAEPVAAPAPMAALPAAVPVPMRAPRGLQAAHRAPSGARNAPQIPRLAVLMPPAPAGEPLQLAAMIAPAPAPEAGRTVLGITVPKLPYEDKIVAPLVRARDAVRSLF